MIEARGMTPEWVHFVGEDELLWQGSEAKSVERALEGRWGGALRECDAVVVNGEGTIHHGAGLHLLALLGAGQEVGKRTYLINATLQGFARFSNVLARLDALSVREPRSARLAESLGARPMTMPDSCLAADFSDEVSEDFGGEVVVGDGHHQCKEVVRALDSYGRGRREWKVNDSRRREDWRHSIANLATASVYITGRHHGVYLAALAGTPFVALPSNTWKIESLIEWSGCRIPMCRSVGDIERAVEYALDNPEEFQRFRGFLLGRRPLNPFGGLRASTVASTRKVVLVQVNAREGDQHVVSALGRVEDSPKVDVRFWPFGAEAERVVRSCGRDPFLPGDTWSMAADRNAAFALARQILGAGDIAEMRYERRDLRSACSAELSWRRQRGEDQISLLANTAMLTGIADRVLHTARPALLLTWNMHSTYSRVLTEAAARLGVPTAVLERGPFAGTMYLDRGYNETASIAAGGLLDEVLEGAEEHGEEFLSALWDGGVPGAGERSKGRRALGVKDEEKLVLFADQGGLYLEISGDCNGFGGPGEVLDTVCELVGQHQQAVLAYRAHPKAIPASLPKEPLLRAEDLALNEALAAADVVVVINSSVGLRAMSLGLPVVYCGKSMVSHQALALSACNPEQLQVCLSRCLTESWQPDLPRVRRYLKMLSAEFLIDTSPRGRNRLHERLASMCAGMGGDTDLASVKEWAWRNRKSNCSDRGGVMRLLERVRRSGRRLLCAITGRGGE